MARFVRSESAGGTKTWIAMYRHGGRKRRMKLGTYPAMSLADARAAAKRAFGSAEKGGDPAGEKTAARQAETFGEMAEQYMREYVVPNKRSWRKDRQALDRDFLPRFQHRKAADITRREIVALLKEIRDTRGAPVQANRCREIIRRIYGWAVEEEIVTTNPCLGIKPLASEQSRDRVLTHDEIRDFWKALDTEPPLAAAIFKVHLLTAQRGGEVSRMRCQDLDLSTA
jgi:integrase